jgi:hypothetical protein
MPLTWSDWVSGEWLGTANPMGVVKPALAGSVDNVARAVGATLDALDKTSSLAPPFMLQAILDGARSRLRGRDLVIRNGDGELRLHLDDLQFDLAAIPLAVGQLGTIHVDASAVSWPGGSLDTLHVEFANVHIRPGFTPVLVSAPIRLHATIGQAALDGFLDGVASKVRVELGDKRATAIRPGRETWGHAAVEPRVEAGKVRLVATGITVRSRALRAPGGGVPSLLVDLPRLPGGMQVRHMELGDRVVHVDALVEEIQEPITAQQLANVSSLVRLGAPEIDLTPETAA